MIPFKQWLKMDARQRALRTALQSIVATALTAGLVAANEAISGGQVDTSTVLRAAGTAALTGALTAALAYLHRTTLDPSRIPSISPEGRE